MVKLKRIDEAKQVGTLYHVCSLHSAIYNIKNNSITPSTAANKVKGKDTISFTRDKLYIVDTLALWEPIIVQFEIDGDLVSEKQKFTPYAALGYQNPHFSEKEEVLFGPLKNLKKYTKCINILVVKDVFATSDPSDFDDLATYLKKIKESGYNTKVLTIYDRKSTSVKYMTKSPIPKDISDLINICTRVYKYNSPVVFEALNKLCTRIFKKIGSVEKTKQKIDVFFNEEQPIKEVCDFIDVIIDTIKEELESKDPYISFSFKDKNKDMSLPKLLHDKKVSIESFSIFPIYDFISNKTPVVVLHLSKPEIKTYYVYFPL